MCRFEHCHSYQINSIRTRFSLWEMGWDYFFLDRFEESYFRNCVIKQPKSKPRGPCKRNKSQLRRTLLWIRKISHVSSISIIPVSRSDLWTASMIIIECTLEEAEVVRNMYESSDLEWLVYDAPVNYVNLLLHGYIRGYLKNVKEYCHLMADI